MNKMWRRALSIVLGCVMFLGGGTVLAQDDEEPTDGWKDSAELSYVLTEGNADTSSLGFKNKTWRRWETSAVEFNLGGVRAQSADSRFFLRLPNGEDELIEPGPKLTAENYWFDGTYYQEITPRFYWQAGASWARDTFAGVENRYIVFGGVGNLWVEKEKMTWRTDYSASYTIQDDVVEDPTRDDTYFGIRATSNFKLDFGKSSSYGNDTILDFNVDDTDDWRADMSNWVSVTMTTHLALKVNLQWRYSNSPRLEELPVLYGDGTQVGTETAVEPLEKLDTILTASLVVNF